MRIEGHFQGGGKFTPSPYIKALVVLSSGVFAPVNFLVDTGAFRTTLHPSDAQKLGIRALPLGDPKNQESTGIGGNAQYSPRRATILFAAGEKEHAWEGFIQVGPCGDEPFQQALRSNVPSLLGRDFLNGNRLVVDYGANELYIELL